MTEAEWLTCRWPTDMLAHLNRQMGDRKLLLYAVACCKAHMHLLPHRDSQDAVIWAELYADKLVEFDYSLGNLSYRSEVVALGYDMELDHKSIFDDQTRILDWCEGTDLTKLRGELPTRWTRDLDPFGKMAYFAHSLTCLGDPTLSSHEEFLLLPPLHDIFGNPFHTIHVESNWRTAEVVGMAKQMYESHDFSMMPALGDTLQDIGCNNEQVLAHCYSKPPHVRGCWVVDLLLGKE